MTDVAVQAPTEVEPALSASASTVTDRRWSTVTIIASLTTVAICLLWRQTIWVVIQEWQTRTYSHGFVVLPICIYLLWTRRHWIAEAEPRPTFLGIVAALGCALGWILSNAGEVRVFQEFCLVGMIVSAIWSIVGTKALRRMALPLAFLIFAVPFGDSLIAPLQDFTAAFAVAALRLSGVPTFIDGRTLTVPTGDWQVAEACSGISYLISMFVVTCLFAAIAYRTWWRRALLLVAAIAIPILANGVRAYGIVMLAYFSNNRLAVGVDHIIYGWIFFAVLVSLLFAVAGRWREPALHDVSKMPDAISNAVSAKRFSLSAILASCALPIILAAVAAIVPSLLWTRSNTDIIRAIGPVVSIPWRPTLDGDWQPVVTSEAEFTGSYSSPARQAVNVFIRSYALNSGGVVLASGSNPLLAGGDATVWRQQRLTVSLNGHSASINENIAIVGSRRRLIWSWYTVAGAPAASSYQVKVQQAKARLLHGGGEGQVIAVSTEIYSGTYSLIAERNVLQAFLNSASFPAP